MNCLNHGVVDCLHPLLFYDLLFLLQVHWRSCHHCPLLLNSHPFLEGLRFVHNDTLTQVLDVRSGCIVVDRDVLGDGDHACPATALHPGRAHHIGLLDGASLCDRSGLHPGVVSAYLLAPQSFLLQNQGLGDGLSLLTDAVALPHSWGFGHKAAVDWDSICVVGCPPGLGDFFLIICHI